MTSQKDKNDPFETHKKASFFNSTWGGQPKKTVEAGGGKGYKADHHHHRPAPPDHLKLFWFPMVFFIVTALSFAFLWEIIWGVPVIIACVMLSSVFDFSSLGDRIDEAGHDLGEYDGLLPALSGPGAMRAMRVWLHITTAWMAVFLGAVAGINADEAYISQFYAISYGREYKDVMANTKGAAYADAGKIEFKASSKLASKKSVGFKDQLVYCAAPILDEAQGVKSAAFWAVGYDCCEGRGKFKCGNGASGRKGVRVPEDGVFHKDRITFLKAVNQSAAVNKLEIDEEVVLLHWVKDPDEEATSKFLSGLGLIGIGTGMFACLVLAISAIGLVSEHEYTKKYTHHSLLRDVA